MGSYLLDRYQEILSEKVRETLSNHLFRKSGQIDDWMWQRTHEVTRWSASFVVFEGVEALTLKRVGHSVCQRILAEASVEDTPPSLLELGFIKRRFIAILSLVTIASIPFFVFLRFPVRRADDLLLDAVVGNVDGVRNRIVVSFGRFDHVFQLLAISD